MKRPAKLLKSMVGLGRFELPTHGLGNRVRPVHPVWNRAFSIGYSALHSDQKLQFGQEYAPQYAPLKSDGLSNQSNGFYCPICDSPPHPW